MAKRWLVLFMIGFTLLFGAFWLNGVKSLDPDFGWHLKVGQLMLSKGIPVTDPFSYTMPTFPWVDHGRMSDVVIAWLYPKIGIPGLAAILALAATAALMIAVPGELWGGALVPLLFGAGVFVARFGVRPQVEDWLFTAILLRIAADDLLWKKWRRIIPVIFIIWANFHGGWLVGFLIIGMRVIGKWWETKKLNLKDTAILGLSVLATLVNPYGIRLWGEIWLTITDTNLRSGISEWQPFYMKTELGYWLLTSLFFALYKIYGKVIPKWRIGLLVILLLGSLSSLRNVPFYVLAVIPLTAELFAVAYSIIKKDREMWSRARKFYAILLITAGLLFGIEVGVVTWKTVTGGGVIYPTAALTYLQNFPIKGRLFTDYGWGGYLIWKLPGEKEFIDGRMPSWRRPHFALWGFDWGEPAPAGESVWAFKDYEKIAGEGDYQTLFNKFGVETVLWPKENIQGKADSLDLNLNTVWWWKWLLKATGRKPQKSFIKEIAEKGWKKVYEDKTAVIYTSP
jgi:hypothetical protein